MIKLQSLEYGLKRMPTTIGLRVYKIIVGRERNRTPISFDAEGMVLTLPNFTEVFIIQNAGAREPTPEETELDRKWFFEPAKDNAGSHRGVVRYGISGFESDIVDSNTNRREFRRAINHMEIIPLFYEFWFPSGVNYAFAVFQSFSARSCVELVSAKMRADFSRKNPGFTLSFLKLMPTGKGGIYDASPVKGLRFIKRNAPSDVADRYLNNNIQGGVNFEISINARRKGSLGSLRDLTGSIVPGKGGVIEHDGVIFDEAVAEIEFGGRRRRVAMLGSNSEAGVIDLTDIKRGRDGHPVFSAICQASSELLADFDAVVRKS